MQIILNHEKVRVHKLAKPVDRKGELLEIAVSMPEAGFELTRDRAEVLAALLAIALDATGSCPIKVPTEAAENLVFLRRQAD